MATAKYYMDNGQGNQLTFWQQKKYLKPIVLTNCKEPIGDQIMKKTWESQINNES